MATSKNPFVWTEIYVDDLTRAQKFYETVLEIEMSALPIPEGMDAANDDCFEMVSFPGDMNAAGISGALVKSAAMKPGASGTLIYFGCKDCAVEISRAAKAGGKVLQEKMSIGQYGFCGTVKDTEGNVIGFHSME